MTNKCKPSKADMLEDARLKYHLLETGQAVRVVVDSDGSRVEYSTANRGRLKAYIEELKRELSPSIKKNLGPIGFSM